MAEVAVVILNLNGRRWLDACLASLRALTVSADVLLADNGSSDGSPAYVREHHPGVRVLELGRNLGFAAGYNRALCEVDHPWVVLLNNDAALQPDWLEHLLAHADREPHAAILGGRLLFSGLSEPRPVLQSAGASFTDAGTAFEIGWGELDGPRYDRVARTGAMPGAAMLVRRSAFLALGGFAADYYAYLEDVDLCWRAWLAGYEVHYVPQALAYHRYGASGGGRAAPFRIRWMQRNRLANMVKNLERASLPQALAVSLAYDAYRVIEYAGRGRFAALRALAAGTLAFQRDLRLTLSQRARVQASRRVSDRWLRQQGLLVSALTAFREYRRLDRVALPQQGQAQVWPGAGADRHG